MRSNIIHKDQNGRPTAGSGKQTMFHRPLSLLLVLSLLYSSVYIFSNEHESSDPGEVLLDDVTASTAGSFFNASDDLLFIHHSVGRNWLDEGLHNALLNKSYVDQRNNIYYDTVVTADMGRPKSLGDQPGDRTDMNHWLFWFNDYLESVKDFNCSGGQNRIIMFKSCYPTSDVQYDGSYYGDPFDSARALSNYKAVYRNLNGTNATYLNGKYSYHSLEYIFEENPDTLFIPVTAPPRHYAPNERTNDTNAHRARLFNNWLKNDWLEDYNTRNPELNNVYVFDFFDFLTYLDNDTNHPNRLKKEYGGASGNSHPNTLANTEATKIFALNEDNILDNAWNLFNGSSDSDNYWMTFGHDNRRSGLSGAVVSDDLGTVKWSFTAGGDVDSSPIIDLNGTIYVGSDDKRLHAVYSNGTERWNFTSGGVIDSTSALDRFGNVYFGSGDGKIYCLDGNGSQVWNYTTGSGIHSSPLIDEAGAVYIGSDDGYLYCLYPNGSLNWRYKTNGSIRSSPAMHSDAVLFGSDDDSLHAVHINGSALWSYSTGGNIRSTAAVDEDGNVYFGSDDGLLYALHLNGSKVWNRTMDGIPSSPSLSGSGSVIVGTTSGSMASLTDSGALNWNISLSGSVYSKPAVDVNGTVIITTTHGYLYSIASNGSILWNISIGGGIRSSPCLDPEGSVFLGSGDDHLYAVGMKPPSPPVNVSWSAVDNGIRIFWDPPEDNGGGEITGYSVYRKLEVSDYKLISGIGSGISNFTDEMDTSGGVYSYYLTANNSAGESKPSEVIFTDSSGPVFLVDHSSGSAWCGSRYVFNVSVEDDGGISKVTAEYWFGDGPHANTTMEEADQYLGYLQIPFDSLDDLHYRFTAVDIYGNTNSTDTKTVSIYDGIRPVLSDLSYPSTGSTGDNITIRINSTDNIKIDRVNISYGFGDGDRTNESMDLSDGYSIDIRIPISLLDSLQFRIYVIDSSGNMNSTDTCTVRVHDGVKPTFIDRSDSSGTTGDELAILVEASDNIGINSVNAIWNHGIRGGNETLNDLGNCSYGISITADDDLSNLTYRIMVNDTSGNTLAGPFVNVGITDNDDPVLTDNSDRAGYTGDRFLFNISAGDNIGIKDVYVTWNHGSKGAVNDSLNEDGYGTYSLGVILDDSLNDLVYRIWLEDSSGNRVTGDAVRIDVEDNDAPALIDLSPNIGTTGDDYIFNVSVEDNIGVVGVIVSWSHGSAGSVNQSMVNAGGNYRELKVNLDHSLNDLVYTITTRDGSGNINSLKDQKRSVTDNDAPTFTDNSPASGTTGDPFGIKIAFSDNIGTGSAGVTWSHGTLSGSGIPLNDNGGGIWSADIVTDHSIEDLTYFVSVVDTSGNHINGSVRNIGIEDNDDPSLQDLTTGIPTTGDRFSLKINASDNIGVDRIEVAWSHASSYSESDPMIRTHIDIWTLDLLMDIVKDDLEYHLAVFDTSGNFMEYEGRVLKVMDNDAPRIIMDRSDDPATTGEIFNFSAEITDNTNVSGAWVEFRINNETPVNMSMSGEGIYQYTHRMPHNRIGSLSYRFITVDMDDNWNSSSLFISELNDNDLPVILEVTAPGNSTTGDPFIIRIKADDNIGLSVISVEYWFGEDDHFTDPMILEDEWSLTIAIPNGSTEDLHFLIHMLDLGGNRNSTEAAFVLITDNDPPVIASVISKDEATTGDVFQISCDIGDNIGVSRVWMEYRINSEEIRSVDLSFDEFFYGGMPMPLKSTGFVNYTIYTIDVAGNLEDSGLMSIPILDNDPPEILDMTYGSAGSGEKLRIQFRVTDNINVNEVYIIYQWGLENPVNFTILLDDSILSFIMTAPSGSIDPLQYTIYAVDDSLNLGNSTTSSVIIMDGEKPHIYPIDYIIIYQGEEISVNITASDNIGIDHIEVLNSPVPFNGTSLNGIPDAGTYIVTIVATDVSGLTNSIGFTLMVRPVDHDRDGDLIPDLWEIEYGLDPDSDHDAGLDHDLDSLTNREEFLANTHPRIDDTDGDLIPDGWEVGYGLDPLSPSGDDDGDGDGITDLEEYLDGSDPCVYNERGNDPGSVWIPLLIVLTVILILVLISGAGVFIFLMYRKPGKIGFDPVSR